MIEWPRVRRRASIWGQTRGHACFRSRAGHSSWGRSHVRCKWNVDTVELTHVGSQLFRERTAEPTCKNRHLRYPIPHDLGANGAWPGGRPSAIPFAGSTGLPADRRFFPASGIWMIHESLPPLTKTPPFSPLSANSFTSRNQLMAFWLLCLYGGTS